MMASRRRLSWALLGILFLSLVAIQGVYLGKAPTIPNVFVDPPETIDPGKIVGSTFTINVNVSNVQELYGWQVNMTFNPAVVNTTVLSIKEGPFLKQSGYPTQALAKKVNNTLGTILVGYMLKFPYPPHGASGSGTLVNITFTVRAEERGTLLRFVTGTKLNTVVGTTLVPIEHTTEDGLFDNRTGNASPLASFSADPSTAGVSDTIRFNASASYDPDAWLVSYHWDYGDDETEVYMRGPLKNINLTAKTTHTYTHAGIYTVALTVTDNDGATATTTASVTIGNDVAIIGIKTSHIAVMPGVPVTINATVANEGYGYVESFNVTAYYNDTAIETQELVDFAPQTETTVIFTWNTTSVSLGKYIIKVNATVEEDYEKSNNELVDGAITISLTNIVDYPVVVGGFTFHVIVESTSITSDFNFIRVDKRIGFNVTGETGTGGFTNVTIPIDLLGGPYTVFFEDASIIPEPQETTNGTHTFLHFTYAHSSHMVEIHGTTVATPPIAIFTTSTSRAVAGTPVSFNATDSYDPDGNIEHYHWNFGDGNITTVDDPIITHSYTSADNCTVTLTVEDNKQLINSAQATITIIDHPNADFTYYPTAPLVDATVTFNASNSQANGGKIINYRWHFGDGNSAIGITANHTYGATGKYEVVLNVTDDEGLWDIETRNVTISIHNIGITALTATPDSVRIGQQVTISITVTNKGNFAETFDITAYYDDTAIQSITATNLATEASETKTILWDTTEVNPDTYNLKAIATAVTGETETNDNTFIVENAVSIQKLDSQLSISASPTVFTLGATTNINGTISPIRQSATITILYKLVDEQTWKTLGTATTNAQGQYTIDWKPDGVGTYEIIASWQGDTTTFPSESTPETITVQEPPTTTLLYIGAAVITIAVAAAAFYFLRSRKH
ncbi:MAG TPA: PKD domain-containing protein [Candidatus Bathyarchaeia archaeon]|nr:PKD domain-containing protein [Candidatus Bathyarchaeia archaeon]